MEVRFSQGHLANLLSRVRQEPEVRPEAVRSASERLASGELDTPEARLETANRIVDGLHE